MNHKLVVYRSVKPAHHAGLVGFAASVRQPPEMLRPVILSLDLFVRGSFRQENLKRLFRA